MPAPRPILAASGPAALCHSMAAHRFVFPGSIFPGRGFRAAFTRRPRHPLVRVALGLLGLGVLALLVFFSVFVGVAMLSVGLLYRLLRDRRKPAMAPRARVVEGEYRVVGKTALPSA